MSGIGPVRVISGSCSEALFPVGIMPGNTSGFRTSSPVYLAEVVGAESRQLYLHGRP
mgnify:CR=1 FL=1